jgi:CheY-like chemotaxis protein
MTMNFDTSRARILVVDDDPLLLDLLVDTLRSIGYDTTGVADGAEALEALSRTSFDMMITDIRMPGMDGLSLLKRVKRYFPQMPVLFITGVASPEVVGHSSADGVLAKPFRISHMEELIQKTLASSAAVSDRQIRKVMVVDDDDLFLEMLTDALRINGFTPLGVSSGRQALDELNKGDVDAVITDIRMPGMSGLELLDTLKQTRPELPVVLITAFLADSPMDPTKRASRADAILEKPFQVERIVAVLNELSATSPGNTE